jgi:hypothetical protein
MPINPCAKCGESIHLTPDQENMLRRSEQTFFCLWGHSNYFPAGDTPEDVLRRERDRLKQQVAQIEDERSAALATASNQLELRRAAERRVAAMKGQVTRLKTRAANGVCPCCNRTFTNLARHMASKHAGFVAEEVAPNGATVQ